MDRQQIGLKLTLDALGQPLDLSGFAPRLVLQKAIYLAQAAGVDLGYSFSWYLRGPYSPGLTRDAFALKSELSQNSDEWTGWTLDGVSVDRLRHLSKLIASPSGNQAKRLELLASVHFLLQTKQATPSNLEGLRKTLLGAKKDFPVTDIEQAIKDLTTHDLLTQPR